MWRAAPLTHHAFPLTSPAADDYRAYYNLNPLCAGPYYHFTNDTTGLDLYFQLCGTADIDCVPVGYNVQYNRGNAVQFIGPAPDPPELCVNNLGQVTACTGPCEILGEGPPVIKVLDPAAPYNGVSLSYYGIPSLGNDNFACPIDPRTGGSKDRNINIEIICEPEAFEMPFIDYAYESDTWVWAEG